MYDNNSPENVSTKIMLFSILLMQREKENNLLIQLRERINSKHYTNQRDSMLNQSRKFIFSKQCFYFLFLHHESEH